MKEQKLEALALAEKNVRDLPTSAKFINEKGDALYMLGRYSDALGCYDRALKIRQELEYLANSGLTLIRLNENDRAFDIFEEVVQADSKYLLTRADQLKKLNRHEDAAMIYGMKDHIALKKALDSISFSNSLKKIGAKQTTLQASPGEIQFNLGVAYATGKGVTKDDKQAVALYRLAAEQGHKDAQYRVGVCYAQGTGVTKDEKQAAAWYRKAAEQGHKDAQLQVGWRYEYGVGVIKDEKEAIIWYQKSAQQGNDEAGKGMGRLLTSNPSLTKILYPTSPTAEQKTPTSQNSQGFLPVPKVSTKPSPAEQLQLQDQLIAACKQGDEKAVLAILKRGAKPDLANAAGEQPLGVAVWSMCLGVVNALLKQVGGVTPMTWDECEKHNLKHYKEVFIVPKFAPRTFKEWYQLLQKMDQNPYICAFHFKQVEAYERTKDKSWATWKAGMEGSRDDDRSCMSKVWVYGMEQGTSREESRDAMKWTEKGYGDFRTQIKQAVETAPRPTVGMSV